ncbi:single-stranded DNA-binding protein [Dysgonomonas massiliensis]|uniref:single-stranded DNA-binding protein n=1 Tax=Dysgonomonas massiliensis TaxID=2040292 RepID=UPI000C76D2C8|nr:single-stranded DNA-binding protein [Dysgonomonas massiliensis]
MSVNKVILIGNVGKDPDVKYFDNGNAVANFTLATTERGYSTSSGVQVPDRTEWHNIVCWRGLAKIAEQYVRKGTMLYIEGKIRTRSYDDTSGVKRYVTEIYVDNLELLSRRDPSAANSINTPVQNPPISNMNDTGTVSPADMEDDLPF